MIEIFGFNDIAFLLITYKYCDAVNSTILIDSSICRILI